LIALVCVAAILFTAVAMPDALAGAELLAPLWLFLWLILVLETRAIEAPLESRQQPLILIHAPRPPPFSSC